MSNGPSYSDENPYASPQSGQPTGSDNAHVKNVPVLGVLTAINGGLMMLMGLFYFAYALFIPTLMNAQMANNPGFRNNPAIQGQMETIMLATGIIFGSIMLLAGIAQLIAGLKLREYQSRTIGIVALSAGLISIFTCYCLPTSLGVFIYGLIVLLNEPVKRAFQMGDRGDDVEIIRTAFGIRNDY